jgi:hypothetical protein
MGDLQAIFFDYGLSKLDVGKIPLKFPIDCMYRVEQNLKFFSICIGF